MERRTDGRCFNKHGIKFAPVRVTLQVQLQRTDPDDFKGFLRLRKDLFLDSGLLYRKAFFRSTGKQVNQFVMPTKIINALSGFAMKTMGI